MTDHLFPPATLSLPVELFEEVIRLLPFRDRQSLSLVSQVTRKLTLPFIFGHLKYTQKIMKNIRNMHQARQEVKEVIKKLVLRPDAVTSLKYTFVDDDDESFIFRFLETLPHLRSFEFSCHIPPADNHISPLIASLRHAPLLEFTLDTRLVASVEGSPTIGLPGLKKLSIVWKMSDAANQPGSAHNHLYELIRPSLTTLVDLRIGDFPVKLMKLGTDFDLQLLKPAGNTLRSFEYRFGCRNESILDTIPVIFPHLTTLKIAWWSEENRSCLWKDEHINALARNRNLTDLTLSSDFEFHADDGLAEDEDYAWYVRSYKRRLKVTQEVALACIELQRCCWIQHFVSGDLDVLEHRFIVEERVSDGKRVRVRGVKQYWMGQDNECFDGTIVKCKLEDLPGDIIDENDIIPIEPIYPG